MRLVLRPTLIQPSSTTLRYYFDVELGEDDVVFLEKLAETGLFSFWYDKERGRASLHDTRLHVTYASLAALYLLRRAKRVAAGEGNIARLDAGFVFEPKPHAYLVIADPSIGCHVQCPWCYARPRPLDMSIINVRYGVVRDKWYDVEKRLADTVARAVKAVIERAEREGRHPAVTIVVGGSTDPTSIPPVELGGLYAEIHAQLQGEGLDQRATIAYSLTSSNPVGLLTIHDVAASIVEDDYPGEIVATMLPPDMVVEHPWFKMNPVHYYEALAELAKKGVTIAYMLTSSIGDYDYRLSRLEDYIDTVLSYAKRVFLLHHHPTTRHWKPPTRDTILEVMEKLIVEGKQLPDITIDACTAVKLGWDRDEINKMEAQNMIYCTPKGCRHATICPRGAQTCIA